MEIQIRLTKQRREVLRTLELHGGEVADQKGFATGRLKDLLPDYGGSQTALSGVLKSLEAGGLIERNINGKRCYAIKLSSELMPAPNGNGHHANGNGAHGPEPEPEAEPVELAPVVTESVDYRRLSYEILATCNEILGKDPDTISQMYDEEQAGREAAEQRVGELEMQNAILTAELKTVKGKLADAENNIRILLSAKPTDGRSEAHYRNIDRMVRERPMGLTRAR